jgi:predicted metal-dependent enzyme (double-stranded beta helix superfamily)
MPQELTSQLQAKVSAFIAAAKDMTGNGVTRSILKDVTGELEKLAVSKELFPRSEFPPPDGPTNILYQIACDPDGQYALYVSSANKGKKTPPHNHATWAVIVGIEGDERNKLYRRLDDGSSNENVDIEMTGELMVREGQPIALMPEDIHSIHVESDEPTLHLHLYGRRLEDLKDRLQFDMERRTASHFPPNPNIR